MELTNHLVVQAVVQAAVVTLTVAVALVVLAQLGRAMPARLL